MWHFGVAALEKITFDTTTLQKEKKKASSALKNKLVVG